MEVMWVTPHPLSAETTHRRLAELRQAGYSTDQIAAATGRPAGVVEVLPHIRWVSKSTMLTVAAAHRRLLDVDEMAVQRLMAGDPPAVVTSGDRCEAARRLRARGHSLNEIARRLGVRQRQVSRDLAALAFKKGAPT